LEGRDEHVDQLDPEDEVELMLREWRYGVTVFGPALSGTKKTTPCVGVGTPRLVCKRKTEP